jgi:hypothetical protein
MTLVSRLIILGALLIISAIELKICDSLWGAVGLETLWQSSVDSTDFRDERGIGFPSHHRQSIEFDYQSGSKPTAP